MKIINFFCFLGILILTNLTFYASSFASNSGNMNQNTTDIKIKSDFEKTYGDQNYWQDYNVKFFGSSLFNGNFANQEYSGISPDYKIAIDDTIDIRFWGAFNLEKTVKVDKQGSIFLPEIGTIKVAGIENQNLNSYLEKRISSTFNKNVKIYSAISSSTKLRVVVTGFVNKPGTYEGLPFSPIVYFIDKAGGVNPDQGSYIKVSVIRNKKSIKNFNLYDFLTTGMIDQFQFHDGDVVHVGAKQHYFTAVGEILNRNKFEIDSKVTGRSALGFMIPNSNANRVIVTSNKGDKIIVRNFTLKEFEKYTINPDDKIELISQTNRTEMSVSVKGEHEGEQVVVLPYGGTLSLLINNIKFTQFAEKYNLILYRKSAAKKQKEMFDKVLDNLERKMLNYSPMTVDDARIHQEEVKFLTAFIEKARNYQPNGVLTIYNDNDTISPPETIYLEDEDVIFVPKISNFVSTFGYVTNPSFLTFDKSKNVKYYIEMSGGFLEGSNKDEIFIRKVNGNIKRITLSYKPKPGEEIIVFPVIKFKTFQFAKDIIQAIYQIAVTARIFILL